MKPLKIGLMVGSVFLNVAHAENQIAEYQPRVATPADNLLEITPEDVQPVQPVLNPDPEVKSNALGHPPKVILPPNVKYRALTPESVLLCAKTAYEIEEATQSLTAQAAKHNLEKSEFETFSAKFKKKYNNNVISTPSQLVIYKHEMQKYNARVNEINAKSRNLRAGAEKALANADWFNTECKSKLVMQTDTDNLPEKYKIAFNKLIQH